MGTIIFILLILALVIYSLYQNLVISKLREEKYTITEENFELEMIIQELEKELNDCCGKNRILV